MISYYALPSENPRASVEVAMSAQISAKGDHLPTALEARATESSVVNPERSPSFCALPWTHLFVSPQGEIKPCCRYVRGKEFPTHTSPGVAFESDYWNTLRKDMLENTPIAGCAKCDHEERLNTKSLRKKTNTDDLYSIDPVVSPPQTRSLEVAFSNTCNLSCVMCDSRFSSSWRQAEKQLYGKTLYAEKKYRFSPDDLKSFPGLKLLKVTGGEPFLEHKLHLSTLEHIVAHLNPSGFRLDYSTNLTVLPKPEIIELWSHFERVEVTLSLDSIFDSELMYIRYPSQASVVRTHVRFFLELMHQLPNLHVVIRPTVHVLNIASMLYTLQWWLKEKAKFGVSSRTKESVSFLAYPDFLHPLALSPEERASIAAIIKTTEGDEIENHRRTLLHYLHEKPFNAIKSQRLSTFLRDIDTHRNTDFKNQFLYLSARS